MGVHSATPEVETLPVPDELVQDFCALLLLCSQCPSASVETEQCNRTQKNTLWPLTLRIRGRVTLRLWPLTLRIRGRVTLRLWPLTLRVHQLSLVPHPAESRFESPLLPLHDHHIMTSLE